MPLTMLHDPSSGFVTDDQLTITARVCTVRRSEQPELVNSSPAVFSFHDADSRLFRPSQLEHRDVASASSSRPSSQALPVASQQAAPKHYTLPVFDKVDEASDGNRLVACKAADLLALADRCTSGAAASTKSFQTFFWPLHDSHQGIPSEPSQVDLIEPLRFKLDSASFRQAIGSSLSAHYPNFSRSLRIAMLMQYERDTDSSHAHLRGHSMLHNSASMPGLPMYEAFSAECRANPTLVTSIVYHGTPESNIECICASGLDPTKRMRQAYGPGEYFGKPALAARYYVDEEHHDGADPGSSKGFQIKLVAFAVLTSADKPPCGERVPSGDIVVVKEVRRQLPLGVLTFTFGDPLTAAEQKALMQEQAEKDVHAAEVAAAEARKAATEAEADVQVMQPIAQALIRGDYERASELYWASVTFDDDGTCIAPGWSDERAEYLAPKAMTIGSMGLNVSELFPGAIPDMAYIEGSQCIDTRKIDFRGSERMLQRASTLRADACRLEQKATHRRDALKRMKGVDPTAALASSSLNVSAADGPSDVPIAERPMNTEPARPPAQSAPSSDRASARLQTSSGVASRRLMQELRGLRTVERTTVHLPDEADMYIWSVSLTFDEADSMGRQLCEYATRSVSAHFPITASHGSTQGQRCAAIELELRFPADFPSAPPFVRVVSPRFEHHTGHVTVGGSICMHEITASGWRPNTTIETLLLMIRTAFVEGEGQLHHRIPHVPYALHEAREAFTRVARAHGWQ